LRIASFDEGTAARSSGFTEVGVLGLGRHGFVDLAGVQEDRLGSHEDEGALLAGEGVERVQQRMAR
jgi:hypothetical protein